MKSQVTVTTVIITPAMKEGNQYLNTNPNNPKHANAILSVLNGKFIQFTYSLNSGQVK